MTKIFWNVGTISSNVDKTLYNTRALAHHTDARTRIYPQVAGQTVTLVSDGAADTFGDWVNIIPINTVDFAYKVIGLVLYGVDTASSYFIQLGHSTTDDATPPATSEIMGEREIKIVSAPISRATEILEFWCSSCPANAKLWGRLKTDGGATDEAYIAVVLVRHISVDGHFEILTTWPWST